MPTSFLESLLLALAVPLGAQLIYSLTCAAVVGAMPKPWMIWMRWRIDEITGEVTAAVAFGEFHPNDAARVWRERVGPEAYIAYGTPDEVFSAAFAGYLGRIAADHMLPLSAFRRGGC